VSEGQAGGENQMDPFDRGERTYFGQFASSGKHIWPLGLEYRIMMKVGSIGAGRRRSVLKILHA
jgi:hypothetical protein